MEIEKAKEVKSSDILEVKRARLITWEEVRDLLPRRLREYEEDWWTMTPGLSDYIACYIDCAGYIRDSYVCFPNAVRPVLDIDGVCKACFHLGDIFEFGGKEFRVISENLAICEQDLGNICYMREEDFSSDGKQNIYEKSTVKKFIDEWFERSMKERGTKNEKVH